MKNVGNTNFVKLLRGTRGLLGLLDDWLQRFGQDWQGRDSVSGLVPALVVLWRVFAGFGLVVFVIRGSAAALLLSCHVHVLQLLSEVGKEEFLQGYIIVLMINVIEGWAANLATHCEIQIDLPTRVPFSHASNGLAPSTNAKPKEGRDTLAWMSTYFVHWSRR